MYTFNLKLYKNKSDINIVDKILINEKIITGISRTEINILTPTITISQIDINDYNYCYISELERFYYIIQNILNTNATINLNLKVDVLMTYSADIKSSYGLITKQRVYNPYYGNFDINADFEERRYNFENIFTDTSKIILVALRG